MIIVADEGVDRQIVDRLRRAGHTVLHVAEMAPGISDEEVLSRTVEEAALLVTADKDFGELVYRQRMIHTGILLVRLPGLAPERKAELVASSIDEHGIDLRSSFSVLTENSLRVRKRAGNPD